MRHKHLPEGDPPPGHATERQADAPLVDERTQKRPDYPHAHMGAAAMDSGDPNACGTGTEDVLSPAGEEASKDSSDPSPENTQEQNPGAALLSGMRTHLRSTGKRVVAANAKVPDSSNADLSYLFRINQCHQSQEQAEALGPLDVKRLFLNVYAYTLEKEPQLLGQLHDPEVLRQIYEPYAMDVMRFRKASTPRAMFIALLHSSSLLDRIAERYGAYSFINKTAILNVFNLSPRDPEKALAELVAAVNNFKAEIEPRLREEYGIEGAWELSFIRFMIQSPLDAETAAGRILNNMRTLRRTHPHIHPGTAAAWAETQVFPHKSPAHATSVEAEMQNPYASLKPEGREKLEKGKEQLTRIRRVTRRPEVVRRHGTVQQSVAMTDLTEQVVRRRDPAFNALNDIPFETMRLESAVFAYNDSLDPEEAHLKIDTDMEILYGILLAYALEVGTLRQKGYELGATTVAWYHDAEVYDRYIAKYVGKEGATAEEIAAVIRYQPTHIEQQIESLLIRKRYGL